MAREPMTPEQITVAEAVRQACVNTALIAYEDARIDGLCHEGAWECAVDAMRSLELAVVVTQTIGLSSGKLDATVQ